MSGNNNGSLAEAIQQGMSQSINQTGQQVVSRSLNIQPTITIRPGFPVRVMVTHDLDSLHAVCDRIAVLAAGRVIATGPIETMLASEHPWLKSYFRGTRGRQIARDPVPASASVRH